MKSYHKWKKNLKLGFFEGKIVDFGLETRRTKHNTVAMMCAPKRAFRIGVICANRTLIAKVMAKILSHIWKLPQLGQITISCQSWANLPTPSNSVPSMCNLKAQHRLTQIPLHQEGGKVHGRANNGS
jgi:hypothetical protein